MQKLSVVSQYMAEGSPPQKIHLLRSGLITSNRRIINHNNRSILATHMPPGGHILSTTNPAKTNTIDTLLHKPSLDITAKHQVNTNREFALPHVIIIRRH